MEEMVEVKNVKDKAVRKDEQGNPEIFPRKKLDTNEKHFKMKVSYEKMEKTCV